MNESDLSNLRRLAALEGIQTSYLSMSGETREASPETLRLLLRKFGHAIDGDATVKDALRAARKAIWQQAIPETLPMRENQVGTIRIRQPRHRFKVSSIEARIVLESGESLKVHLRPLRTTGSAALDGSAFVEHSYLLPRLPCGYHMLQIEIDRRAHSCLLISAPPAIYERGDYDKKWGVFAPLYALHSPESWGAGNFSDWRRLLQYVSARGGGIVSSLPVLSAFLGKSIFEPSPYSPASRLFWNEFYIDVTASPEFSNSASARKLVQSKGFSEKLNVFRRAELVDYQEQMAMRSDVLRILASEFFASRSERQNALANYLKQRPEAEDYAAFRAACDQAKKSWHAWDARQKNGKLISGKDYDRDDFHYYLYAQWLAQEQMNDLIHAGRKSQVELYLDLPLGVHPDSYDAWRERESFAAGVNAGCPPDPCFTKGQDWGFSPLDPKNMRKNRYEYLIRFFQFQMRHTGLLRVDHVMGLHRLYWIPQELPASEGAYVTYPARELYAILAIESHRHQTMMVGENLGTTPPEVNRFMDRFRMRRMYVAQYELLPKERPLPAPPEQVVASLNTHDMPAFTAYMEGLDINDRRALGLLDKKAAGEERKAREKVIRNLRAFLKKKKLLKNKGLEGSQLARAALKFLAGSQAETVLLNLEDLWGETEPQNVPGTSKERPNWRRKLKLSLADLEQDKEIEGFLAQLHRLRKKASAKR
jgi:4-alpha-glucanotransferase